MLVEGGWGVEGGLGVGVVAGTLGSAGAAVWGDPPAGVEGVAGAGSGVGAAATPPAGSWGFRPPATGLSGRRTST